MVDFKKTVDVGANFTAEAAVVGAFPPPVAAGSPTVIRATGIGTLFVTLTDSTGSAELNIGADDSPAPANPQGLFTLGKFDATLPNFTDGDAVNPRHDGRGRLLTRTQSDTGTTSTVAASAASVNLLASNPERVGATVWNESPNTCFLKLGATASMTDYTVQLQSNDYYEVPYGYIGDIDAIWTAAAGDARITELT